MNYGTALFSGNFKTFWYKKMGFAMNKEQLARLCGKNVGWRSACPQLILNFIREDFNTEIVSG
jgi:hypothetical protein